MEYARVTAPRVLSNHAMLEKNLTSSLPATPETRQTIWGNEFSTKTALAFFCSFASLSKVVNKLSGCQDLSWLARKQESHPAKKTAKLSSWTGRGLAGTLRTWIHFAGIASTTLTVTTWQNENKSMPISFRKRRIAKIHRHQQHTQLLSRFQL